MPYFRVLSNDTSSELYGSDGNSKGLSNEAIITIVLFSFIALCIVSGAIYLLIKGKNISEILEESIEDEACGNCMGFMNDSMRTDDGILPDEDILKYHQRVEIPNIHQKLNKHGLATE